MTPPPGRPRTLTSAQARRILADEGIVVTATTVRIWIRRGYLVRAEDGRVDALSVLRFMIARRGAAADDTPGRQS